MDFDGHEARRLLHARRSLLSDEHNLYCLCPPFYSTRDFSYQEINHVLGDLIDTDGPLGVIRSLLSLGADVNFERRPGTATGLWSKITQQQQPGVRSNLLLRATIRCRPETVKAIAAFADSESLESAFCQATMRKDLAVLHALLDHGGRARPSSAFLDSALGKAYEALCENDIRIGQEIIEKCLAEGSSGPETIRFEKEGLVKAVQCRSSYLLDTTMRLATTPEDSITLALVEAVQSQQINVMLRLLRFTPTTTSLTTAISEAIKIDDASLRYEIIRILVGHGAKESCAAEALVHMVREIIADENAESAKKDTNMRLFQFLLDEGMADVDHNGAEALQLAVQAVRFDVVREIVSRQPSSNSLGLAVPCAMAILDRRTKRDMIQLLFRYQVNEEAAGRALVEAVRGDNGKNLIRLLLTKASVNYNNGEAFIYAIRQHKVDIVGLFLEQGTNYKALFTALREALNGSTSQRRVMFGILLRHLHVDHLNEALKHLILEEHTDLCLVDAFLQAGAEAVYDNGVCIKNAAYHLDRSALRMLSEHSGRHEAVFAQALSVAIGRGRQWISYEHVEVIQLLLRCGGSEQIDVVSRAMTEVVDHLAGKGEDTDLANALLDILFSAGADINYEGGKAVEIATKKGDILLLARLLRHKIAILTEKENVPAASPLSDEAVQSPSEPPQETPDSADVKVEDTPDNAIVNHSGKTSPRNRHRRGTYFTQTLPFIDEKDHDADSKALEAGIRIETKWSLDSEKIPVVSIREVTIRSPPRPQGTWEHQPPQVPGKAVAQRRVHTKGGYRSHPFFTGLRKAQEYGHSWRSDSALKMELEEDDWKTAAKEVVDILNGRGRKKARLEMVELKTKRGLVIGHADLTELRRWQSHDCI